MQNDPNNRLLDHHIGNFIDALEVCQDEASVRFSLKTFARDSGFSRFVYADMGAKNIRRYSDYPDEWQRRYLSRNYVARDPIVAAAKRTMRPTVWSIKDRNRYGAEQRNVMDEANEFGIASGVMVPIHGGFGRTALLALASDHSDAPDIAVRDVAYVATAVAYVHINLLRLSNRTIDAAENALSPREQTCLIWASLGKTKAETARLLGISEKTVRYYLDCTRDKLGAVNTINAVRIAAERGFL